MGVAVIRRMVLFLGLFSLTSASFAQNDAGWQTELTLVLNQRPRTSHGYPLNYTKLKFLPDLCDYTMDGGNKDRRQLERYFEFYGRGFVALHHYCRGMFRQNECLSEKEENKRLDQCRAAVSEYGFVLDRTDRWFRLRPEILVKTGMAYLAYDQGGDAVKALAEAIELRSDYVPPYVVLSNYFQRIGDVGEARRVLQEGIARAPQSEVLKRKLRSLEGDQD